MPSGPKSDLRSGGKIKETADLLAQVELELRHADAADDQIGEHAAAMEGKAHAELEKRRKVPGTLSDDRQGAEYLRMLKMRRQAQIVGALASESKRKRGA